MEQEQTTEQIQQQTDFVQKQSKISEMKYKIYCFVLVVLGIWLQSLINVKMIWFADLKADIGETRNNIEITQMQYNTDLENNKLINLAKENFDDFIKCINNRVCQGITTNKQFQKNLNNIRTYYLIDKLEADKMDLDQKAILRYIDEYLLKKDGTNIGTVESVTFGNKVIVNEEKWIYKLPINLQIEFDNKDNFVNFVLNVERYLDPSLSYRAFLKIVSMNYNIANYETFQKVNLIMEVYYYR